MMAVSEGKKGKTIHSEARNIMVSVINKCDEESKNNCLSFPLKQSSERAANYISRSVSTVCNIRGEYKRSINAPLSTPGKKRKRAEHRNAVIDDFDKCVIRNIVMDYYIQQKKSPSIRILLNIVREKIDFPWKRETLRKVLHDIGFKWKKCANKRTVLIERPDIVNWRVKYLQEIKKLRAEGKNIFYMDETWVDSNLTFQKCWQSNEVKGILTTNKGDNRLVIVHVGSDDGFLNGALLVFKAGNAKGDYHGQMNRDNFHLWLQQKLLPSLPPNSVLVMDNAPYHNTQLDKPPTQSSVKKDMVDWLQRKGIECDMSMLKVNLLELITQHKPPEKQYKVDSLLISKGHIVLRLPPYMCDLNPIELAWSKVKRVVREQNVTGSLCLTKLKDVTLDAISTVTKDDWAGYVKHVKKVEQEYWRKDCIMEDTVDSIVIQLGVHSDDESSTDNSLSDESHVREEDDDEYARPLL